MLTSHVLVLYFVKGEGVINVTFCNTTGKLVREKHYLSGIGQGK